MRKASTYDMLGVTFSPLEAEGGPAVDSERSPFYLPYYKDEDYFSTYENEIHFYKGVEDMVRKHPFYKKYIRYLIEVVGIKSCQVLSHIEIPDDKKGKVTIEMHHGPILTLFDIAEIVTRYYRKKEYDKISVCFIANVIIEEHRLNNIHTVFLAKSVHDKVTDGEVFLNYQQGFGDTETFLEKYREGITKDIQAKINRYIEECKEHDSYDNDVFRLEQKFKVWGNNDFDAYDFTEET